MEFDDTYNYNAVSTAGEDVGLRVLRSPAYILAGGEMCGQHRHRCASFSQEKGALAGPVRLPWLQEAEVSRESREFAFQS